MNTYIVDGQPVKAESESKAAKYYFQVLNRKPQVVESEGKIYDIIQWHDDGTAGLELRIEGLRKLPGGYYKHKPSGRIYLLGLLGNMPGKILICTDTGETYFGPNKDPFNGNQEAFEFIGGFLDAVKHLKNSRSDWFSIPGIRFEHGGEA